MIWRLHYKCISNFRNVCNQFLTDFFPSNTKMKASVFLLVLVGSAASGTQDYGEAFATFLGELKRIMPCGHGFILRLDPIVDDMLSLDYTNGETKIEGGIRNFRLSGLSNFKILQSTYDARAMYHVLDIMFAKIQIFGSLKVNGTFGIAGFLLPFEQSIQINVKLTDLRIMADYFLAQSPSSPNGNGLSISQYNVKFTLGDLKAENWHKSLDIALNNYFNDYFSSFSLLLVKEMQPYVNDLLETFGIEMPNEMLSYMTINELIDFYEEASRTLSRANCTVLA